MRSLLAKLLLAFALTSLTGIALAALFVRQLVTNEFDTYVLSQRRADFVEEVTTYYTVHGSWEGIAVALQPKDPPVGGEPRPPFEFMLADAKGIIVSAPNPLVRGRPARTEDLTNGIAIRINTLSVGTVITLGPTSLRNPAEARYLASTDLALGAAAVIAVVAALTLGLLLARVITRPVRDLTKAVQAMANGDLRQHVQVRSRDELGLLAHQFNQMSADLDRANELRRRMTADIAHDLRTPITVIAGYLEALRDESLRPTPARFAAMYDETQILMRLVQDLHTISLVDAGELQLKTQSIDPQALLERVATSYQPLADQNAVTLTVDVAPDLPNLHIDNEQMVRALGNLVGNALRHTPAGGRVTLSAREAEAGIALLIADTGEGIPAEHLPNIFERFYRADSSRHQATGGSGLGLAIVKSIVEAHRGQVMVESNAGEGSRFTLVLPRT